MLFEYWLLYILFLFRYLNDLDYDLHYGGLGVTPLPLHGQVRPIKVEQDTWNSMDSNDEHSSHNISSTPPILRRRARKREADDHEVGYARLSRLFSNILFLIQTKYLLFIFETISVKLFRTYHIFVLTEEGILAFFKYFFLNLFFLDICI